MENWQKETSCSCCQPCQGEFVRDVRSTTVGCRSCEEGYRLANAKSVQHLHFSFENLLYSIENLAYVEGDVMPLAMDGEPIRAPVIDVGQDGNIDRVRRVLDLAFAEVVEALFPYTKLDVVEGERLNDDLQEREGYDIELRVPLGFSRTTLSLLENLIHEYAVCCVLSDWLSMTNIAAHEKWELRKQSVLLSIRDNLGGRVGKRRRKPSVF